MKADAVARFPGSLSLSEDSVPSPNQALSLALSLSFSLSLILSRSLLGALGRQSVFSEFTKDAKILLTKVFLRLLRAQTGLEGGLSILHLCGARGHSSVGGGAGSGVTSVIPTGTFRGCRQRRVPVHHTRLCAVSHQWRHSAVADKRGPFSRART